MSDGNHDWNKTYRKEGAGEKAARAGKKAAGAVIRTVLKFAAGLAGLVVFFSVGILLHIAIFGGAPRGGSTIAGVMGFLGIYAGWQACSWALDAIGRKAEGRGIELRGESHENQRGISNVPDAFGSDHHWFNRRARLGGS